MPRTREGWIQKYEQKGAYWLHDGNHRRPHALLTSGKHSNGFFNGRPIIEDDRLLREAGQDLVTLFVQHHGNLNQVSRVVGPKTGGEKLAKVVASWIGQKRGFPCDYAACTKVGEGSDKTMVFDDPENTVKEGECVLLVDDVLTTAGSVEATEQAVLALGGKPLDFVLVLVNRSVAPIERPDDAVSVNRVVEKVGRKLILALIDQAMPTWEPEHCPYCKAGSESIRPKDPPEWARLNAVYPKEEPAQTTEPVTASAV